ncbi:U3 small nucleolar RNA-associated protein 6-domain-containing protein [Dipodascopsis uninucleata]
MDKVRYYLEQVVPELEDLQKKGVFNKEEIASIMKRRSDFEHRIISRGSKQSDYLKYIEYEMNLEALRKRRIKRLGIQSSSISEWAGTRRIYFVFDRATKKFSGDISLWIQFLEFTKQQKANNVSSKIFNTVLRLHPLVPSLWILAAQYEIDENGNVEAARNLMKRGLKFNPESEQLIREYSKLEVY